MTNLVKILFVCPKNISLSPMAAQIFLHLLKKQKILNNFSVDSAALSPNAPLGLWLEPGAKECLMKEGIDIGTHSSVVVNPSDCEKYDWIICMSEAGRRKCLDIFKSNAVYVTPNDVRRVFKTDPSSPYSLNGMVKPRVCCLMDFTGVPHDIVDPANFERANWRLAFAEIQKGCSALLSISPFVPTR